MRLKIRFLDGETEVITLVSYCARALLKFPANPVFESVIYTARIQELQQRLSVFSADKNMFYALRELAPLLCASWSPRNPRLTRAQAAWCLAMLNFHPRNRFEALGAGDVSSKAAEGRTWPVVEVNQMLVLVRRRRC